MSSCIEWLTLPKEGERENGDAVVVRRGPGRVLVAVVDALGHGAHAASAARAASETMESMAFPEGPLMVIDALHERLRGTRGAAALVCVVADGRLEGCSVGNVEMRCHRSRLPIMLSPGVIGAQLRRPRVFEGDLADSDRLVMFSDGVSSRFSLHDLRDLSPADACRSIFAGCRRAHDDATVLVMDLRSGEP
jgi:negative regulator of sigma-B (phosphoserine phosphatase)